MSQRAKRGPEDFHPDGSKPSGPSGSDYFYSNIPFDRRRSNRVPYDALNAAGDHTMGTGGGGGGSNRRRNMRRKIAHSRYKNDSASVGMQVEDAADTFLHPTSTLPTAKRTTPASRRSIMRRQQHLTTASHTDAVMISCKYWSNQGRCRLYPQCRFKHEIRLVAQQPHAHQKGIYEIASASSMPSENDVQELGLHRDIPVVDIYTASQDKTVKKWMLYSTSPTPSTEPFSPSGESHLKLRLSATIELEAPCLSLFHGQGCLICGLNNGIVKVFDQSTGYVVSLKGHSSEIHCVRLIDDVLATADWSGQLKLWKADPVQKTFVDTVTLDIGSPITCFIEVPVPNGRQLWAGCTGSIRIIDLLSLSMIKTINIPSVGDKNVPVVMSLLFADQHVICCLLDGQIKIYTTLDGQEVIVQQQPSFPSSTTTSHVPVSSAHHASSHLDSFCSMTGSSSTDGPVLICGKPHGVVSVLGLPDLQERLRFKHHDKDVRAVHNIGGNPSYFVTASFEGSLCVWYWSKPK